LWLEVQPMKRPRDKKPKEDNNDSSGWVASQGHQSRSGDEEVPMTDEWFGGPGMTDVEFRQWLHALARKHVKVTRLPDPEYGADLRREIEWLSSLARFCDVVSERAHKEVLVKALFDELSETPLDPVIDALDNAGVLAALDELPEITFGQLRRSAIPEFDVDLLSRAGVRDPEAEIAIIIGYAGQRLSHPSRLPSEAVRGAQAEVNRAAHQLVATPTEQPDAMRKKRKILTGIGKVLTGAVTGAGNLLLATGTIIAPNLAMAYAVIGSSALAVGSIFQGLGDLRGE
jgi:hypothetical protein